MKFGCLEAEVGKGVPELPLRLHDLRQLGGQRLRQPDDVLVLALVVAQHIDLGLQIQVYRLGATAELLRQNLTGALEKTACSNTN